MDVQIHVVGAGSIGLLISAKLAAAGARVTIWTRTMEQAELIAKQGLLLHRLDGKEQAVRLRSDWIEHANANPTIEHASKWIIITVKQTHLDDPLLSRIAALAGPAREGQAFTAVLALQNGIGHMRKIGDAMAGMPLYAAVTSDGARRLDMRTVSHTGAGELWFGSMDEKGSNGDNRSGNEQKMLLKTLQSAGFAAFLSNDSEEMMDRIYNKLLVNAVINPLTSIFDVNNGDLPNHPRREALMRALYAESEMILVKAGMTPPREGWQSVLDVCGRTSGNISSMLSDVRAGRSTEIEAINGGIADLAERHGINAPLNLAVIALIEAMQGRMNPKGVSLDGRDME
ncbi:ketopantoate reductase family protein [Paenibacillus harenae]|uniref:ketopantoate reductase family protein n=1 Tax=Paenibacillus harenae TaxID=306543 RepID=UPI0027924A38|nr:2-dehydropantoate 2-reductase [Paenibacillus harenae]MDQ0059389.1 2-dehydropantoate 2-reductase [Paenibacillus harenae]